MCAAGSACRDISVSSRSPGVVACLGNEAYEVAFQVGSLNTPRRSIVKHGRETSTDAIPDESEFDQWQRIVTDCTVWNLTIPARRGASGL
jgi:hypothetical protein